jgi:2-oxoisovalerate dehydrogenase E2 component (dihydrolipoyl transacylase)
LARIREQLKPIAEQRGIRLSYMPLMLKALSIALKAYPTLNSHTNPDCTAYIQRARHNIGVAMDTPAGLLVPNIKDVQSRTVFEIAQELNRLQALGKDGKLSADDLSGGTFTLSNVGVIGMAIQLSLRLLLMMPRMMPDSVAILMLGTLVFWYRCVTR